MKVIRWQVEKIRDDEIILFKEDFIFVSPSTAEERWSFQKLGRHMGGGNSPASIMAFTGHAIKTKPTATSRRLCLRLLISVLHNLVVTIISLRRVCCWVIVSRIQNGDAPPLSNLKKGTFLVSSERFCKKMIRNWTRKSCLRISRQFHTPVRPIRGKEEQTSRR